MNSLRALSICLSFLFVSQLAICAPAGFADIQCDSNIPKVMIGRLMPNEKVVAIEERHKNIGLKNLGGTEISNRLFLVNWQICGKEYVFIDEASIIRDVLEFPPHSKTTPQFIGSCGLNGKELTATIIAVLSSGTKEQTSAVKVAWKIDELRVKFVKIPAKGLFCPREGIVAVDGGL